MASTPVAKAPLYQFMAFWNFEAELKPAALPKALYHTLHRRTSFFIVRKWKYWDASCCIRSLMRPSEKASGWGIDKAATLWMRLTPSSLPQLYHANTAPWSCATKWKRSMCNESATAKTSDRKIRSDIPSGPPALRLANSPAGHTPRFGSHGPEACA
eukprot:CAMPEP_0180761098 /NCGR_PEP_ID=MMETSP1038_2-20121128/36662_1 /TAXON_ID=632150 /ORGANISM="Azadinium spinosum, Strain 3D9" /LENGTH=156 /DNA_ID=CAMNT_0022795283 /DNA_START=23 /DNA_END=494 /DNA_ORIENTATION=+